MKKSTNSSSRFISTYRNPSSADERVVHVLFGLYGGFLVQKSHERKFAELALLGVLEGNIRETPEFVEGLSQRGLRGVGRQVLHDQAGRHLNRRSYLGSANTALCIFRFCLKMGKSTFQSGWA